MSTASIQHRISPPVPGAVRNISDAQVKSQAKAVDGGNADTKVDFRDLVSGSNAQAKAEREAKKAGDLSGAKSELEFFKRLEDQTKQVRTPKNALDKDDFLKLFVTQLQHQDPSQPKDSSEMAAQLAQFNGLEQMMNINKGIEKLTKTQGLSRSLELVGYIGKEVTIPKGRLRVEGEGGTSTNSASFITKSPTVETTLVVRDSSGAAIAEKPLGNFGVGEHKIEWDGKKKDGTPVPKGVYNFEITAKGSQGEQIPVDIATRVKITGVDLTSEGSFDSEIGKLEVEEIRAVTLPGIRSPIVDTTTKPAAAKKDGALAAMDGANGPPQGIPPEVLAQMQKAGLSPNPGVKPSELSKEIKNPDSPASEVKPNPNASQAAAASQASAAAAEQQQNKAVSSASSKAGDATQPSDLVAAMDPNERSQIFHPQVFNNVR